MGTNDTVHLLWDQNNGISSPLMADGWNKFSVFIAGAGPHQLEWRVNNAGVTYLDQLSFTPAPAPSSLAEALDQPTWSFRTNAGPSWEGYTTAAGKNDNLAAISSASTAPDRPWVETTVLGPGLLTFQADNYQYALTVNGSYAYAPQMALSVNAGPQTVRWTANPEMETPVTLTLDDLQWYPNTWNQWLDYRFGTSLTQPSQRDSNADPDGDRLTNAAEALLGTDPLTPDAPPIKLVNLANGSPRCLYPEFVCAKRFPSELIPSLESATSLAGPWAKVAQPYSYQYAWTNNATWQQIPGLPPGLHRVVSGNPDCEAPARFWRLRVEKP